MRSRESRFQDNPSGDNFCRVKWDRGDSNAAKTVALGSCLQHSRWDRDMQNKPGGSVATLLPWIDKAGDDALWATVPLG